MATKTWQVNTMERELADGYVSKVIYRVDGSDGTYKFRATGEVSLPKPSSLVPYADLTESQVLTWVKARIEELNKADSKIPSVAQIEAIVENGVNEQKTPTIGTGKPW
tara:strand:- start:37 stop:360 length:324 start_codon:yes stop_codon:yes gene_type:complete